MKAKTPRRRTPKARSKGVKIWQLRLYVTDETPKSQAAILVIKGICDVHLKGRYRLKVIDLLKHPHLAKGDQILAIPTLVRQLPVPIRIIIGNLSDIDSVLVGLDLRATFEHPKPPEKRQKQPFPEGP